LPAQLKEKPPFSGAALVKLMWCSGYLSVFGDKIMGFLPQICVKLHFANTLRTYTYVKAHT
jgi:hypothetical protein